MKSMVTHRKKRDRTTTAKAGQGPAATLRGDTQPEGWWKRPLSAESRVMLIFRKRRKTNKEECVQVRQHRRKQERQEPGAPPPAARV